MRQEQHLRRPKGRLGRGETEGGQLPLKAVLLWAEGSGVGGTPQGDLAVFVPLSHPHSPRV